MTTFNDTVAQSLSMDVLMGIFGGGCSWGDAGIAAVNGAIGGAIGGSPGGPAGAAIGAVLGGAGAAAGYGATCWW